MDNIIKTVAEDMIKYTCTEIKEVISRFGLPVVMADEQISTQVFLNLEKSVRKWLITIFQGTWPEGDQECEELLRSDLEQYFFENTYLSGVAASAGDYQQAMCSALFTDKDDQKRMDEFMKMDIHGAIQEMSSRCEANQESALVMRKMAEVVEQQKAKALDSGLTSENRVKEIIQYMSPLICLAAIAMSRPDQEI